MTAAETEHAAAMDAWEDEGGGQAGNALSRSAQVSGAEGGRPYLLEMILITWSMHSTMSRLSRRSRICSRCAGHAY